MKTEIAGYLVIVPIAANKSQAFWFDPTLEKEARTFFQTESDKCWDPVQFRICYNVKFD